MKNLSLHFLYKTFLKRKNFKNFKTIQSVYSIPQSPLQTCQNYTSLKKIVKMDSVIYYYYKVTSHKISRTYHTSYFKQVSFCKKK